MSAPQIGVESGCPGCCTVSPQVAGDKFFKGNLKSRLVDRRSCRAAEANRGRRHHRKCCLPGVPHKSYFYQIL